MVKINFGQALRTVADKANPFDGTDTDYDVFGDISVNGGVRNAVGGGAFGVGGQGQVKPTPTASTNRGQDTSGQDVVETQARLDAQRQAADRQAASGADLAYLDIQERTLRDQLARTQTALDQGLSGLGNSYNKEVSGANQQRERAMEQYGIQDTLNAKDKQGDLSAVDTNSRNLNNSVRRILGLAGAGGGSAQMLAAPKAIADTASTERNQVLETDAANQMQIGNARKTATEDFESLLKDLATQRSQREGELRTKIDSTRQDINANLGDVAGKRASARGAGFGGTLSAMNPYQSTISGLQGNIDRYFNDYMNPKYDVKQVQPKEVSLRDYLVNAAEIGTQQSQAYDPNTTAELYRQKLQEDDEEQLV